MGTGEVQFRTATFGGFHKEDVLSYVERLTKDNREKLEQLQRELTQAQDTANGLQEQLQQAQQELSSAEQSCIAQQEELIRLQAEAEDAEKLRTQLSVLEPKALAYDRIKDKAAGIELDAHQRAKVISDEAEAQITQLRLQAETETKALREEADAYAQDTMARADTYVEEKEQALKDMETQRLARLESEIKEKTEQAERRFNAMRLSYDEARRSLKQSVDAARDALLSAEECVDRAEERFRAHDQLLSTMEKKMDKPFSKKA